MKMTKKLLKDLTTNSDNRNKLYTTNKYISNGEIALLKEVIDNPNIIEIGTECIVGNETSFNNIIDSYSYTNSQCEVLCDRDIEISEFQYKKSPYNLTGEVSTSALKNEKLGRTVLYTGTEFYKTLNKDYVENKLINNETCIGINSLYLDIFNKLNKEFKGTLKLKQVILKQYCEGTSYDFLTGYYRIVDSNNKFIGVIMGVQAKAIIGDLNSYIVLEPIDNIDNNKDRIIIGEDKKELTV